MTELRGAKDRMNRRGVCSCCADAVFLGGNAISQNIWKSGSVGVNGTVQRECSGTSVEGKCVLLGFSDCLIQEDAHRYLMSLNTFYSPFPM